MVIFSREEGLQVQSENSRLNVFRVKVLFTKKLVQNDQALSISLACVKGLVTNFRF